MDSNHPTAPHFVISKGRLEFLVDGVFAIAMTILVLELKVPEIEARRSVAELGHALLHDGPTFLSYLLSFAMLGVFWHHHNRNYRHFHFITAGMLALQLGQLAVAAFFPFAAALLGRYPFNALSNLVYLACPMIYFWCGLLTWHIAMQRGAIDPAHDPQRERKRALRGCCVITLFFFFYLLRTLL